MAPVKSDFRRLTGPDKAAILMLALNEDKASKIFEQLQEDEIKEISQAMASLGGVKSEVVEDLFADFTTRITSTGTVLGNIENTERLLRKVLKNEKVDAIMEEIRGPAGRTMWDKLGNVNEEVLANYLKNEYPQTISVVMSKIKPEHAARVLSILPEGLAMEVVARMLRMEVVQKDVLSDVERTLRTEFMSNLARTNRRDAHEMMAEIFNNLDRTNESRFLQSLEERNKDSAERIRALMFTFEDLSRLDATGVQTLLRGVDKSKLSLALKGATDGLKNLFFSNMSTRAAKMLREDMQALGPVRLREVDESQMYIVNLAKDLAAKGEIVITDSKGEDELVY
ncbi:MAG: flagellar motor switch protein FliG [Alphaproteobacteria bacterium]